MDLPFVKGFLSKLGSPDGTRMLIPFQCTRLDLTPPSEMWGSYSHRHVAYELVKRICLNVIFFCGTYLGIFHVILSLPAHRLVYTSNYLRPRYWCDFSSRSLRFCNLLVFLLSIQRCVLLCISVYVRQKRSRSKHSEGTYLPHY